MGPSRVYRVGTAEDQAMPRHLTFLCSPSRRWSGVAAALLLAGCGGSSPKQTDHQRTTTAKSPSAPSSPAELLSVPAVGRIYGRCRPGDRRWTIEFAPDNVATDSVTYRIGSGRPRTVNTRPSQRALTWRLVPDQFNSHEPADPVSHFPATTIKTTAPVSLDITQGTEPHIYRVNMRFAVAAAIGDTSNCALISTRLNATTYYTGGQPPG
jgi:hypothetical protein